MIRVRMPNVAVPATGFMAGMEVKGFRYWPKYDPPEGNPDGDTKMAGYVRICRTGQRSVCSITLE